MPTYRIEKQGTKLPPLWQVMGGETPIAALGEQQQHERAAENKYGPVRCELRLRLEAMEIGDTIETYDRTANQVSAIAAHVRKAIPGAKYAARTMPTCTVVTRIA